MDYAEPQTISLNDFMADKGTVWEKIVQKYDLQPYPYDKLVTWQFGDLVFGMDYDVILNTNKARHFGFHEYVDSEEMFLRYFDELRRNKIIP